MPLPEPKITGQQPKVKLFSSDPSTLNAQYMEVLTQNPLLARAEGEAKSMGWTDLQIRTFQLLAACRSNASLMERAKQLEESLDRAINGPPTR